MFPSLFPLLILFSLLSAYVRFVGVASRSEAEELLLLAMDGSFIGTLGNATEMQ